MKAKGLLKVCLGGAIAAAVLGFSGPAWAVSTININPGNVPTTAAGFNNHECDANFGGGPFPGQDVWVFVLPGNHATSGDFLSLTADFNGNGSITITTAMNPGNFSNGGPATSKAFIIAPAGFTLTGASAIITGTADSFNLTHTCPASGSPTPSPTVTPTGSPTPTPTPTVTPTATPTRTATVPTGAVKAGGGGSQSSGGLVWGLGALTVAAGGVSTLMLFRRRRDNG
jgi:hypothetical protein